MNDVFDRSRRFSYAIKRCFDMCFSFVMLIALSPIILLTLFLVFLVSHECPIFAQKRVGPSPQSFYPTENQDDDERKGQKRERASR